MRKTETPGWSRARSADLRREETGCHAGHNHVSGEAAEVRYVRASRESRDLRVVPLDWEGDGRGAEDAEIVGIVRVLPDIFGVDHEVPAEGLPKPA